MAKKEDQIGGEGVAESKSPGVRAAVKAAQPTIDANRKLITKVQTAAFKKRQKRRVAKKPPKGGTPVKNPTAETTGEKLKRRADELDKLLKQQ